MDKRRLTRSAFIILLFGYSSLCRPDSVVKSQTVIIDSDENPSIQNPIVTRTVYYRSGIMRRKDSLAAGSTATIEDIADCKTRTGFLIDLNANEYRNYKVVRFASEAQRAEYLQKASKSAVQVESKTVDTGERKVFFSHSAKHLVTTTKLAEGNGRTGEEIIDGWYIDHELPDHSCAPDFVRTEPYYVIGTALVDYPDIAQFRHTGPMPTGLAVKFKLTVKLAKGKNGTPDRTVTIEKTVEALSDSPPSPSLFELPKEVHENPQLFRGHPKADR